MGFYALVFDKKIVDDVSFVNVKISFDNFILYSIIIFVQFYKIKLLI